MIIDDTMVLFQNDTDEEQNVEGRRDVIGLYCYNMHMFFCVDVLEKYLVDVSQTTVNKMSDA